MDAIITAGGIPLPGDPLYEYTRGGSKAMLDIAGKPMIQWVLDALCQSTRIEHLVIIGLTELGGLSCTKPVTFIANQKDMLSNIKIGVDTIKKYRSGSDYVVIAASDVPGVTASMIDWLVDNIEANPADLYYQLIEQKVMEKTFPTSNRTYTHLKGMDVCGGDINAIRVDIADNVTGLWEKLIASRKNPLKQASILGFDILFGLLFRSATLDDFVRMISKRLNLSGKAIICPFAEIGMDVDKPHQLEIMRHYLNRRNAA